MSFKNDRKQLIIFNKCMKLKGKAKFFEIIAALYVFIIISVLTSTIFLITITWHVSYEH